MGSELDKQYFKDILRWTMDGERVEVVENNEHLGQIISDVQQEQKNVELRLRKGRGSLFNLLGSCLCLQMSTKSSSKATSISNICLSNLEVRPLNICP